MTNAELIQKIRRRIKELQDEFISIQPKDCSLKLIKSYAGYAYLDKVLSFLDTLESEKPIPNDLEEASSKFATYTLPNEVSIEFIYEKFSFQEGAKWQKQEMMKNALHGWLDEDNEPPYDLNVVCEEKIPFGEFKHCDKVRIIIVKEN